MVKNSRSNRSFSNFSTFKKIVILIIIACLIFGGLSPTINSIILDNNNGSKNGDDNEDDEMKKTGTEDYVVAVASFYWTPEYPDPGEKITFRSSSHAYYGYITSEVWDFGDGNKLSGGKVTYTFNQKGKYRVTLSVRARGYNGLPDRDSLTKVVGVGQDPFPRISVFPEDPSPGELVTLDGSNSFDPDGNIISYNWSYFEKNTPKNVTYLGSNEIINHRWKEQGIYHVFLKLTDDRGNNNTYEKIVHVSILKIEGFDKIARKIKFEISNYGNITANNINWNVKVIKYSLSGLRTRKIYEKDGYISSLAPGDSEDIKLRNLRRALCKIKLIITADADNAVSVTKTYYGFAFAKNLFFSEENMLNPYTIIIATTVILTFISMFFLMIFGLPFI